MSQNSHLELERVSLTTQRWTHGHPVESFPRALSRRISCPGVGKTTFMWWEGSLQIMFWSILPIAWIWRKARPWGSQNDRMLPHGDGYLGSTSQSRRGPCRYGSCRAEWKIVSVGGETKPDVCEEEDPPMAPFRMIRWKFCWIPGPATMQNGSGLKISSMSVSA
jgi:hypothetical protein